MRVVSARLVALLFVFAVLRLLRARMRRHSRHPNLPAPAQTEQATPAEPAATPEAEKTAREGFPGTLDKFLENDFDETGTAISEVAASGNPRAQTIIEALRDERLFFSAEKKAVYYKDAEGKLFSAETGEAVADEPADLAARRYQQPHPPRHRRGARQPDADGAGSEPALPGGAGGVQIARGRARCRRSTRRLRRKPTRA